MIFALLAAVLIQDAAQSAAGAAAALATAQADQTGRETPFACVRDGSMPEIKMCAAEDMERETERMLRYLETARTRAQVLDEASVNYGARTRQAAWLSESQQAWQVYAERRCAGVHEATSGGTMGSLGYMGCVTEMTRQRAHDIWSDYLTYWDSTPPMLPEPVLMVFEEQEATAQ